MVVCKLFIETHYTESSAFLRVELSQNITNNQYYISLQGKVYHKFIMQLATR